MLVVRVLVGDVEHLSFGRVVAGIDSPIRLSAPFAVVLITHSTVPLPTSEANHTVQCPKKEEVCQVSKEQLI